MEGIFPGCVVEKYCVNVPSIYCRETILRVELILGVGIFSWNWQTCLDTFGLRMSYHGIVEESQFQTDKIHDNV